MNTNRLFESLSAMHPLPPEFKDALKSALTYVNFPKGYHLVQPYAPAHHTYFLEKGFAVAYRYHLSKPRVTKFWKAGEIILSPASFLKQTPAEEIIQLTTEGELLSVSYGSCVNLLAEFSTAHVLAGRILVDYCATSDEKIVDLQTMNSWDRYIKLMSKYPGIELHVSQELIASYLNITPQSLSRLKHDHYRK